MNKINPLSATVLYNYYHSLLLVQYNHTGIEGEVICLLKDSGR